MSYLQKFYKNYSLLNDDKYHLPLSDFCKLIKKMRKIYVSLFALIATTVLLAQDTVTTTKQLEEVIITGQYKPQSVKNSVYQLRVINNERIRLRGANNIQQVLSNELGFRFSSDNTLGTSDVQLMGMSGRNVKILLDGVPMTDRGDTRESLNQVDINTIDRIEIVDGPMSVSYGSDALAGVINIITKKESKENWTVNAKVQEETAGNEYYPFNYQGLHQQSLNIGWYKNKWGINAGVSHIDFNGFGGDGYGRAKSWKPKEQWLGNIKLNYSTGNFKVYYRLDRLDETITGKGAFNIDNPKAQDQLFITNRYMHQLQSEWRMNKQVQLSNIFSYTNYRRNTKTTLHDFTTGTDILTHGNGEQDTAKFNTIVFRTTLQYTISPVISLQPGIDINYEVAKGQRIFGEPFITDYAFFISSEIKPTSAINIRPGLRFIKNSSYDAPPVIPSINTKFILNKFLDLRIAYAYGFRSPALRELYFDFNDVNHNIIGNPNLKAENSNSFSGSLSLSKLNIKKISLASTLNGFYNQFNNLINYAPIANSNLYTLANIEKFKTTGITLENVITYKSLQASLGLSYIGRYNRLSGDEQYKKDNIPNFAWAAEINSNINYNLKKAGTTFSLFYKYTGKIPGYTINQSVVQLTKVGDFSWADFTITKNIFTHFTLSGGVKNIFDVGDISSTSSSQGLHSSNGPVNVSYGRSCFLSLTFQWNKK
jgi:outer membrane receptor for ferrienterochelin and colicins